MNFQKKLTITYLFVAIVPLFFVALLGYQNMNEALFDLRLRSLEGSAETKMIAIREYFDRFREEMEITKNRFVVRHDLPLIARFIDQPERTDYKEAYAALNTQMTTLVNERKEIDTVLFVNDKGRVVYSTDQQFLDHSVDTFIPFFSKLAFERGKGGVYRTNLYKHRFDKNIDFLMSAPIYNFEGVYSGVLLVEISAFELYDMIQDRTFLGTTGETLMVRRVANFVDSDYSTYAYNEGGNQVMYLNDLRFDADAAFHSVVNIGGPYALPSQEVVQEKNGSGISIDYRGKRVLAVWRYSPEGNFGIVSKIDMDELSIPARAVAAATTTFGLVAAITIFFFAWLFSRTISAPIVELTSLANKIGHGELDLVMSKKLTGVSGEIGVLAMAINNAARNLRDLYSNLEKKVEERTKILEDAQIKLREALEESEKLNKVMVGRESRIAELKLKVAELEEMLVKQKKG
jgi:HAMP domain-containing protein